MFNHAEVIAFAIALLASLCLTVPIRHLALRYGMVDKPGPRKVHLDPIPLLGGIAIYLGFVLAATRPSSKSSASSPAPLCSPSSAFWTTAGCSITR
jgi:UDP-N-acetylmuramyl pentapeptide phosphotransferase/UDP-N-acetylglucosamine-1-phosphate transferase